MTESSPTRSDAGQARYARDATTLRESTDQLEDAGYSGQFAAVEDGEVLCFTCHNRSPSSRVELMDMRRTEGASDPDDMVAVAAIVCPSCKTRGTLVLKYGATSSPEESDVLRLLHQQ